MYTRVLYIKIKIIFYFPGFYFDSTKFSRFLTISYPVMAGFSMLYSFM